MALKKYHLLKGEKGWHVKAEGNEKATLSEATKTLALQRFRDQYGKKATKENGLSLIIHKTNGHIQEERTYPRSADPRSSKG